MVYVRFSDPQDGSKVYFVGASLQDVAEDRAVDAFGVVAPVMVNSEQVIEAMPESFPGDGRPPLEALDYGVDAVRNHGCPSFYLFTA